MVKVVVADIDGTLCDIDHILTEQTRDTLNRLLQSNIKVGLASGRQVTNIDYCWKQWGLIRPFDFYIGMNGAMVFDTATSQLTTSHLMNFEQCKEIVEYMKPLGLMCNFFCDDDTHYNLGTDEMTQDAKRRNPNLKVVEINEDMHEIQNLKTYRILFRVPRGSMNKVLEFVQANPMPKGFVGFQTQPICYEIMVEGINKAVGLKTYCDSYNISLDEVYAFGDTSNDVAMLKCCHGVCLCDGTEDAIKAAEFVTDYPCKESGFARFVQEKIL